MTPQFKCTTLTRYPDKIVGVVLLDESDTQVGIYLRDATGGLWPARTVNRLPVDRCEEICDYWLVRYGGLT
jgi:hypothetical protein